MVQTWATTIGESVVKRVVIAALLLVAVMESARAEVEKGVAAYNPGDYARHSSQKG